MRPNPGTTTEIIGTGDVDIPIPDNDPNGLVLGAPIDTEGTVVQATVSLRVDHPFDGELEVDLISPLGEVIDLFSNNFGQGLGSGALDCSGTQTTFNDMAARSVLVGPEGYSGSFNPEQPLSTIMGGPSEGQWNIRIRDTGDIFGGGSLRCAAITVKRVP